MSTNPGDFRPRPGWLTDHEFAAGLDAAMHAHTNGGQAAEITLLDRREAELEQAIQGGDRDTIAQRRLELGLTQAFVEHTPQENR